MIIDTDHPLARHIWVLDNEGNKLYNVIKFDPTTGEVWQPVFDKEGRTVIAEDGNFLKVEVTTYPAPLIVVHKEGWIVSEAELQLPDDEGHSARIVALTWPTLAKQKPAVGSCCEWIFAFPQPGYFDQGVGTWVKSNNPHIEAEGFLDGEGNFNSFNPQYLHWKPLTTTTCNFSAEQMGYFNRAYTKLETAQAQLGSFLPSTQEPVDIYEAIVDAIGVLSFLPLPAAAHRRAQPVRSLEKDC